MSIGGVAALLALAALMVGVIRVFQADQRFYAAQAAERKYWLDKAFPPRD